ncbi:MAG: hypothetical protein AUH85_04320 [Chloroflexi bacterium 13_1_40CM_4_68_4]|nr:MAG: hypothetical protein AUH85_04320 [Chloroflexi bacterium 13_1_40CM_4_68_4]
MASLRALAALLLLVVACGTPPPPGRALAQAELKYAVFDQVGRIWYCDPDFYPIARADEKELAVARFAEVQADLATLLIILRHNHLAAATTDDEKLTVYRDWKQLNALRLEAADSSSYRFSYRAQPNPLSAQGSQVEGTVDASGRITISRQQSAGPPNCPICLADDVRIATPSGSVAVTALRVGDLVWTLDAGRRVAAPIVARGSMPAPAGHQVVALVLADGRAVRLSPGHPLADGRRAGELRAGDAVDGSVVTSATREPYVGETHDLLPAGSSGAYWANGVLLASTLR